ncbi:MAG: flagellar biosynthetic protein FliQ [Planctomycetia bacterium]|jgi:flagellar biosynthetic protein FliQ
MAEVDLVEIVRQALLSGVFVIAPVLLVSFATSTVMGIVQASTGIHEQVVGLVPRLVAIAAALFVMLPWMLERLVDLVRSCAGGP